MHNKLLNKLEEYKLYNDYNIKTASAFGKALKSIKSLVKPKELPWFGKGRGVDMETMYGRHMLDYYHLPYLENYLRDGSVRVGDNLVKVPKKLKNYVRSKYNKDVILDVEGILQNINRENLSKNPINVNESLKFLLNRNNRIVKDVKTKALKSLMQQLRKSPNAQSDVYAYLHKGKRHPSLEQ